MSNVSSVGQGGTKSSVFFKSNNKRTSLRRTLLFTDLIGHHFSNLAGGTITEHGVEMEEDGMVAREKVDFNFYVKFNFADLSTNSWRFLKSFVSYHIVEKYYNLRDENEKMELDFISSKDTYIEENDEELVNVCDANRADCELLRPKSSDSFGFFDLVNSDFNIVPILSKKPIYTK